MRMLIIDGIRYRPEDAPPETARQTEKDKVPATQPAPEPPTVKRKPAARK